MSLYQIISLVITIGTIVLGGIAIVYKKLKGARMGIQALLRAELIREWNYYSEKGYAPIYARENFENAYQQYHALGANGVMDDIRNKFLALPDKLHEDQ